MFCLRVPPFAPLVAIKHRGINQSCVALFVTVVDPTQHLKVHHISSAFVLLRAPYDPTFEKRDDSCLVDGVLDALAPYVAS